MKILFSIFIGGGVGSIARYLLSSQIDSKLIQNFPIGILIVNILGCFLIGFASAYLQKLQLLDSEWKFLLITGFCGGFTTFSTFANDNIHLFEKGFTWQMILNIGLSVVLGLIAVNVGQSLVKM